MAEGQHGICRSLCLYCEMGLKGIFVNYIFKIVNWIVHTLFIWSGNELITDSLGF